MHHAARMRKRYGVADLLEHRDKRAQRTLAERLGIARGEPLQQSRQRLSFDESRGVKELALLVQTQLVDRQNRWMLKGAGDLRFPDEPQHMSGVGLAFLPHDLDRDVPAK